MKAIIGVLDNDFVYEVYDVSEEQKNSVIEDYTNNSINFVRIEGKAESYIVPKSNITYINFCKE